MELTDIFGTLGPACEDVCVLSEMLRNGMTGIRLNLSHETLVDAGLRLRHLHEAEEKAARSREGSMRTLDDLPKPDRNWLWKRRNWLPPVFPKDL